MFRACHSDQAFEWLADPSPEEREVLGAIRYQQYEAVLHTDHQSLASPRHLAGTVKPSMLDGLARRMVTYQLEELESGTLILPDDDSEYRKSIDFIQRYIFQRQALLHWACDSHNF